MKKFSYRFTGLQNVRGIELDNLRTQMQGAQRSLEDAQSELERMKRELEESYDEIARLRARGGGSAVLPSFEGYAVQLRHRLQDQTAQVMRRQHELEQARLRVRDKHQETKILEKHREQQFENYIQEMQRDMQRQLDENTGSFGINKD